MVLFLWNIRGTFLTAPYFVTGFLGEYEVSLDSKGRFLMPSGFRKQLPADTSADRFVLARGFETCLVLYPLPVWEEITQKLARLNDFNPKAREFKRLFLNGATYIDLDAAGRVNIPNPLMRYAGITKDLVFSAQGNKVELWDQATYQAYLQQAAASFSDLAAEVAGSDFMNDF